MASFVLRKTRSSQLQTDVMCKLGPQIGMSLVTGKEDGLDYLAWLDGMAHSRKRYRRKTVLNSCTQEKRQHLRELWKKILNEMGRIRLMTLLQPTWESLMRREWYSNELNFSMISISTVCQIYQASSCFLMNGSSILFNTGDDSPLFCLMDFTKLQEVSWRSLTVEDAPWLVVT